MAGATGRGSKEPPPTYPGKGAGAPHVTQRRQGSRGEKTVGVRPAGGGTEQDTWRDGDGPRTHERPHGGWAGGQAQDCGRTNGLTGGMQLCGCVLAWSGQAGGSRHQGRETYTNTKRESPTLVKLNWEKYNSKIIIK